VCYENYSRDEGRPFKSVFQELAKITLSCGKPKASVVSVKGKGMIRIMSDE
jgi:hypothetical protein